jgi:hypothetical protein
MVSKKGGVHAAATYVKYGMQDNQGRGSFFSFLEGFSNIPSAIRESARKTFCGERLQGLTGLKPHDEMMFVVIIDSLNESSLRI